MSEIKKKQNCSALLPDLLNHHVSMVTSPTKHVPEFLHKFIYRAYTLFPILTSTFFFLSKKHLALSFPLPASLTYAHTCGVLLSGRVLSTQKG